MSSTLFSWFFSSTSPFWRRYVLGLLLSVLSVAPSYLYSVTFVTSGVLEEFTVKSSELGGKPLDVMEGRTFPVLDPDGAKWMLLVENSLKDGTWRIGDSPIDAVGPEGVTKVYWASGYFLYLRSLTMVFLGLGFALPSAVVWAAYVSGPLFLLISVGFVVWLVLKSLPSFWGLFFVLLIFFGQTVGQYFNPLLPDHHGFIYLSVCFWVLSFFLPGKRAWIVSGVFLGVSLWLSVLTTIPLLGIFGVGILISAFSGQGFAEPVIFRKWGYLAAGVSMLLWFLDYFPDRMGMRLEVINPLWALGIVGGTELLYRGTVAFAGRRQPPIFGIHSPLLGWMVPILLVALAPFCIVYSAGSWFWPSFPWVSSLMENISELQPVDFSGILFAGGFVMFILLILFSFLVGKSHYAGFLVTGVLGSIMYSFQARWGGFSVLFCTFFFLLGLSEFVRIYGEKDGFRSYFYRGALALVMIVGLSVLVPSLVFYVNRQNGLDTVVEGDKGLFSRTISDAQVSHLMRADKGGDFVVLGPADLGTKAAYYGGGRTVGSMYWEAWRGLKASTEFWGADLDFMSTKVLVEYDVDYVIFRGDMPTKFTGGEGLGGKSLFSKILDKEVPDWLEPMDWVPTDGSKYQLFRVKKEKLLGGKKESSDPSVTD